LIGFDAIEIGWLFVGYRKAWKRSKGESYQVMAAAVPALSFAAEPMTSQATVTLRWCVRDILMMIVFVAMIVGPAFAALNVFAEKNRL
jgi:hypothetical protein